MPQDADPNPQSTSERSRLAIDFAADRSLAFRRARRHTILVRMLRTVLPVALLALMSSYLVFMQRSISISLDQDRKLSVGKVTVDTQALVAHNPRYEGFDSKGGRFEVRSRTARQGIGQKGPVLLDTIDGTLTDANDTRTVLKARAGTFDTSANVLELFESIDVTSGNGMRAALTRATVRTKDGIITSDQPVVVSMPSGTVHGKALTIEQKTRIVTFSRGVVAHMKQQPPAKPKVGSSPDGRANATDGQPLDVTAATLRIDDVAKTATFSGKVVAAQADSTLEAEVLEVSYDGADARRLGGSTADNLNGAGAAPAATGGRVTRIVAPQAVVLSRGTERATGSSAEFDARSDQAILHGPVMLTAGTDRKATSDRADLDNRAETIVLSGNVIVTQQDNVLKGDRLLVERRVGRMSLTAADTGKRGKGRIAAYLKQTAKSDGKGRQAAASETGTASKSAGAAPAASPFGGLGADPSQPIDITAERLDVDDGRKQAVFRGKVAAVQGDYSLFTDELIAIYNGQSGMVMADETSGAAQRSGVRKTAGDKQPGMQLQKVISNKPVRLITTDGRTARGDSAEFDLAANTVILTGNVILTQGKSITRGPRALIDMRRGSMQLLENAVARAESALGKGAGSAKRPQRVEMLIFPDQFKQTAKDGAAAAKAAASKPGSARGVAPAGGAAGGWSSTTSPGSPATQRNRKQPGESAP